MILSMSVSFFNFIVYLYFEVSVRAPELGDSPSFSTRVVVADDEGEGVFHRVGSSRVQSRDDTWGEPLGSRESRSLWNSKQRFQGDTLTNCLEDGEELPLLTRRGWRIQALRLLPFETDDLFQLCQRSTEYPPRVEGGWWNTLATPPRVHDSTARHCSMARKKTGVTTIRFGGSEGVV